MGTFGLISNTYNHIIIRKLVNKFTYTNRKVKQINSIIQKIVFLFYLNNTYEIFIFTNYIRIYELPQCTVSNNKIVCFDPDQNKTDTSAM